MPSTVTRLGPTDVLPSDAARLEESLLSAEQIVIGEESMVLTETTREAFAAILAGLSAGDYVGVVRLPELLTTQEAADLLRISRPTMVKLLDSEVIPSERPGTHRRVSRAAVMEYIATQNSRRKAGLDELASVSGPDDADELVSTR